MTYRRRIPGVRAGVASVSLIAGSGLFTACQPLPAQGASMPPPAHVAQFDGVNPHAPPAAGAQERTAHDQPAVNAASSGPAHGVPMELVSPGAVHLLETRATLLGPHPGNAPIRLTVALKLHDAAALKQFDATVSDPASPDYRHFLTPEEFAARYGPNRDAVAAVTGWLEAKGIRVLDVSGTLVHTEAPTRSYEQALAIHISDYRMDGRTFYSTTDRATLPRAIAGKITGILGLDNVVLLRPLSHGSKLAPATRSRPQDIQPPQAEPPG